jgi:2-amino-4-hydroxy-6-hydroxymethyldihydropteridine diphosphokinase
MSVALRKAYVGVASNAEPAANIAAGLHLLAERFGALTRSATYVSAPIEGFGAAYWNLVVTFTTTLDWAQLRTALKRIEHTRGRTHDGPRGMPVTLDLDILILAGYAGEADEYDLPWPALCALPHVLVPLAELLPSWRHPASEHSLAELAAQAVGAGSALHPVAQSLIVEGALEELIT